MSLRQTNLSVRRAGCLFGILIVGLLAACEKATGPSDSSPFTAASVLASPKADDADALPTVARPKLHREAIETLDTLMAASAVLEANRSQRGGFQPLPAVDNYPDLRSVLVPAYVAQLPATDGWGREIKVLTNDSGHAWRLASAGADGVYQLSDESMATMHQLPPDLDDPNLDFVEMAQYPSLGEWPVTPSPSTPLKVVRLTALRFGIRGRYVAVQGVVANGSDSEFPGVHSTPMITCEEQPGVLVKLADRHGPGTGYTPQMLPGSLRHFQVVAELDLPALPRPCTLTADVTFALSGRAVPHEIVGEVHNLMETPAGLAADAARKGVELVTVRATTRQIRDLIISDCSQRTYEFDAQYTEMFEHFLPYRATEWGLRDVFKRYMVEHDWTQQHVDDAARSAAAAIRQSVAEMSPDPEAAEWSEFKKRNFAVLQEATEKRLATWKRSY
jgi:hypothetical protein